MDEVPIEIEGGYAVADLLDRLGPGARGFTLSSPHEEIAAAFATQITKGMNRFVDAAYTR